MGVDVEEDGVVAMGFACSAVGRREDGRGGGRKGGRRNSVNVVAAER
jgi:hypothetical protein